MNIEKNRIKDARKAAKLSQNDLAEMMDITQASISGWEKGEVPPNLNQIIKLCEILKVSPNMLLGYDEAEKAVEIVERIPGPYIEYSDGDIEPLTQREEVHLMQCLIRARRGQSNQGELERYVPKPIKK